MLLRLVNTGVSSSCCCLLCVPGDMLQGLLLLQALLLLLEPVTRREWFQRTGVNNLLLLLLLLQVCIMLPALGWLRFACLVGTAGVCRSLWCSCMLLLCTVRMLWRVLL
jgi:hypothetical protein